MSERLQFRRVLPAGREHVFRLWTEPESVKLWFGGLDTKVVQVDIDLRAGGQYAITVEGEEGPSTVRGEFVVVEEPERLVYTWRMESGGTELPETTVEVTFNDLGERTEVLLVHAPFTEPKVRDLHAAGWEACFAGLEALAGE